MRHLSNIIDRHYGQPFLVCGTGPSIEQYSREWYINWPGVIIGVNDIVDLFTPDYLVNVHELQNVMLCNIEGHREEIAYSFYNPSTQVSPEKNGQMTIIGTICTAAMTAAYHLGAKEIFLIGVDLKTKEGQTHFSGCSSGYGANHFIEQADELRATRRGFQRIYNFCAKKNVPVYNLSKDSLLPESNLNAPLTEVPDETAIYS